MTKGVFIPKPEGWDKLTWQAQKELREKNYPWLVYGIGRLWFEVKKSNPWHPKRVCGALKKNGHRCRAKELHKGGKCKHHGGLSTGARTVEGKAKSIQAMQTGWQRWRESLAQAVT